MHGGGNLNREKMNIMEVQKVERAIERAIE